MREMILHSAVKSDCGTIIMRGKSHADCFIKGKINNIKMSKRAIDQGFSTNKREFIDREIAANVARRAGQVDKNIKILFSEDLWSKQSGGKYEYAEEIGYFVRIR